MWSEYYNFVLIFILLYSVNSESTETSALLKTYKSSVSASHDLDRSDRSILQSWTTDFQLQLVNVTAQHRIDMTRHRDNNFMWIKGNSKWKECLEFHQTEISNLDNAYFEGESECLKTANMEENMKRHSVYQVEREIRKWRKGYRYLLNQCKLNNPGDDLATGDCLVEYRLILLKLESMSQLYSQMTASLRRSEGCLKRNLHVYFTSARRVMGALRRCDSLNT